MMQPESTQAVQSILLSADDSQVQEAVQNQRRVLQQNPMREVSDALSFLSILDTMMMPVNTMKAQLEADAMGLLATDEKASGKTSEKAPTKQAPKESAPNEGATNPMAVERTEKQKVQDELDMLTMDLSQLTLGDLRILQQVNHGITPPTLNNLSPSLVQQFPSLHYKSLAVSKGLEEMLESAYKAQKPLRVDLSDRASVIIRMSRNGKVSAEFLPTDQAADLFYRQQLSELKSRLEAKNLPLGELSVRQWKQQQSDSHQQHQQREQSSSE